MHISNPGPCVPEQPVKGIENAFSVVLWKRTSSFRFLSMLKTDV